MIRKFISPVRIVCFVLCLLLPPWAVPAAGALGECVTITVPFGDMSGGGNLSWDFVYSDAYFNQPATQYNHALARCSLGMALASARQNTVGEKDKGIRSFLSAAGFTDFESEDYETETSEETIATMLGRRIVEGNTVLAVAVCGGNYQNEWQGNVLLSSKEYDEEIGEDNAFHAGFLTAATKVVKRVMNYLEKYPAQGELRIWITGYSRAAAVANLASFMLLYFNDREADSRLYAYLFATPRCSAVVDIRDCPGVFNIVGGFDPVAVVPFGEWGYDRYGTTLYLPCQEYCADYQEKLDAASRVSQQLAGRELWNNPQLNWILCKVFQTFDEAMTNADAYRDDFQQLVIDSMKMKGGTLSKLWQTYQRIQANQGLKKDLANIVSKTGDAFSTIAYSLFRQKTGQDKNLWKQNAALGPMLYHEHCIDVYLCWLFSQDDPENLYVQSLGYQQVIFQGDFDVSVTDQNGNRFDNLAGFSMGKELLTDVPMTGLVMTLTARSDTDLYIYVTERNTQQLFARTLVFDQGHLSNAGDTAILTMPGQPGKDASAYTLKIGDETLSPILDSNTASFAADQSGLDTALSGYTAHWFLHRIILTVLDSLAAVLLLILLTVGIAIRRKRSRAMRVSSQNA